MTQQKFNTIAWLLFGFAAMVPLIVWGSAIDWDIGDITIYQWFPLFGLLAWMVMWTHFVTGALRLNYSQLDKPKYYSVVSGYIVLGSLLLHPGLLAYAQFRNGVGVPPKSFYDYVGSSLTLAVIFGSIALLIFLSFEVFNRLKDNKSVRKNWLYISLSQSLAMTLIFVHGIRLGTNFTSGWFIYIWWLCGIILIPCFYFIHKNDVIHYKELHSN